MEENRESLLEVLMKRTPALLARSSREQEAFREFGETVRALRQLSGLRTHELAIATGLTHGFIICVEEGTVLRKDLGEEVVGRLAHALKMPAVLLEAQLKAALQ